MDLQTSLLCLGIVVASTVLIWFILTISTRGQSYEEVMAESRRLAAQRGFLDDAKSKKKQQQSKKDKKAGKKVKEKQAKEQQAATSNSEPDSDGQLESGPEEEHIHHKPQHVEFVEEPAVVVVPEVIPPKTNKAKSKKGKEAKVKPILMNKDDPSCICDVSTPPSPTVTENVNHFEQIHPKDEFELLHDKDGKDKKDGKGSKHGKANKGKQHQEPPKDVEKQKEPEPTPAKVEKQPEAQEAAPKEQRKGKKSVEKAEFIEKPVETASVSSSNNMSQPGNLTTDKIMKQAYPLEASAPQPPATVATLATGDVPTTNGPTQLAAGKKKKNIQLHHLTMGGDGLNVNLLVKVLSDAPLSRSEIQILTDCLLNKQNGPLPEHSEWSEGPKDPMQKMKRQLAEKEKALSDEQEAHQALKAKLKELRASLNSEHSKVSQLLSSAEEININHRNDMAMVQARLQRAVEEANVLRQQLHQLQSKLSAEADFTAQRSQMEMHIQALSENKASLSSALGALQAETNDLRASHSGLTGELHMAREQFMASQHHSQEMSRQMEELTRINADLEAQIVNAVRSEQFIKQELHQANERLKGLGEAQAEIQRLSSVNSHTQKLTMQHEKKQEELDRQNQQLMSEMTKLKSDKEELSTLVKELNDKLAAQSTPNGTTTPVQEDTVSVEKAVAAACGELEAKHSQQLDTLQRQLDQHRDKNNELRTKNWKVMDALQAAEKKIQDLDKGTKATNDTNNLRDAITEAKLAEQKSTKEVLQRLFPKVEVSGGSHDEWLQNFASKVEQQISAAVKSQAATEVSSGVDKNEAKLKEFEKQNIQLQSVVDKYKAIIGDTEGVLSRLQSNVTKEEEKWVKQLAEKQQELDNLKKHSISQLKDKIERLQEAYDEEHKLRLELEQRGTGETNAFMSALSPGKTSSYPLMGDVEKLKEENARLTELVERLHHNNGPSQLPPIPTLEQKPHKKRRSIAGWFRRKITFRRRKHKDTRAADKGRRRSLGDEAEENLDRKSSSSHGGFKTL